ncbi:MAG TPA: nucleotidyltransferase domain-containing protein [Candidatus Acetatifactor stercoripullorum]|uniref:Nucleotidyltransferase domain-containing protein n=1 Tax=Candidatus Acetatifactor stercoripullorum TaxID=2838414 RepID=A0A9D1R4Z2_9FIRM|nr:nucleotidyltransferase domain-containing protein [Candidatus Acetatifactor stercoripullorum]HIW81107.1 nucleotidyltransferase domain-containing protein [Candidatus Acetatifactor stercoripullorum]
MDKIKDEKLREILQEMAELLHRVYGKRLKAVILYGSVARGTQTKDSDVDIMVLVDGTDSELRKYDEKLSDVSTDLALKYLRVFSIIDVKYQEYMEWRTISPFYKNVDKEGVVVYAA